MLRPTRASARRPGSGRERLRGLPKERSSEALETELDVVRIAGLAASAAQTYTGHVVR
jgi:hypothetical protein